MTTNTARLKEFERLPVLPQANEQEKKTMKSA